MVQIIQTVHVLATKYECGEFVIMMYHVSLCQETVQIYE